MKDRPRSSTDATVAGTGDRRRHQQATTRPESACREHPVDEVPFVSVVIPCRNAGEYLERQLDALASEEAPFPWELVVVDNALLLNRYA